MRIDDERIDDMLRSAPAWQPPAGFAERTATRGAEWLRGDMTPPRLWSLMNIAAVIPLAVLTALAVYFAADVFRAFPPVVGPASASTMPATWLWVVGADIVAVWFVLRAYAAE